MTKKANLVAIISSILVIIMVVIIFSFSTQTGNNSVSVSEQIVDSLIVRFGISKFVENNAWLYENRNLVFRKILHFTEYAILALLMFNSLRLRKIKRNQACILTIFFAFLIASADEFYQSHVPGRSPRIFDVLIDTSGALTAILIILLCTKIAQMLKKSRAS